jgi:hypothetical protein
MARATDDSGMVQTAFRLPQTLYDRIAAASGEHGVSYEIRQRLEASFAGTPVGADPKTARLAEAIVQAAQAAEELHGLPWHSDPYSFIAFRTALEKILARELRQPPGKPVVNPGSIWAETAPGATPESLGYSIAAQVARGLR